jgi:hypothetical protein
MQQEVKKMKPADLVSIHNYRHLTTSQTDEWLITLVCIAGRMTGNDPELTDLVVTNWAEFRADTAPHWTAILERIEEGAEDADEFERFGKMTVAPVSRLMQNRGRAMITPNHVAALRRYGSEYNVDVDWLDAPSGPQKADLTNLFGR